MPIFMQPGDTTGDTNPPLFLLAPSPSQRTRAAVQNKLSL